MCRLLSAVMGVLLFTITLAVPAAWSQAVTGSCPTRDGIATFSGPSTLTCRDAAISRGSLLLGGNGVEFGTNNGLSIQRSHPYEMGYLGIRLENTAEDATVRQVMVTDKYQWSIRLDTDGTFQVHEDGPAGSDMTTPDAARITILPGTGDIAMGGQSLSVGPKPARRGVIRIPMGQVIRARNARNDGDVDLVFVNGVGNVVMGDAAGSHTRIRSGLGTPDSPTQGDWWVECTGVSPNRSCSVKVVDSNLIITIGTSLRY
jgi:hypothetical protein